MRKSFLLLAGVLLILTGCTDLLNTNILGNPNEGMGKLQIVIGGTSARTILPSQFGAENLFYTLNITGEDTYPLSFKLDKQNSLTLELDIGTYDLHLLGFISEAESADPANALVQGLKTGIIIEAAGLTTIAVDLQPFEEAMLSKGSGTLSYAISLPDYVTGNFRVFTLDDTEPLKSIPLEAGENSGSLTLDSGFYYLSAALEYDGKEALWRELAHIYFDAVSFVEKIFTDIDFINSAGGAISYFDFDSIDHYFSYVYPINHNEGRISIFVAPQADERSLTNIIPKITFTGTMIIPGLEEPQNFSEPVSYTIYNESGLAKSYTVEISDTIDSIETLALYLDFYGPGDEDSPLLVKMNIDLADNWQNLINTIEAADIFADLDLSACTGMAVFNPGIGLGRNRITSFVLPADTVSLSPGNSAFSGFTSLREIMADEGNTAFSSMDGILYSKDFSTLYLCPQKRAGTINIAANVSSIEQGAFLGCFEIESIDVAAGNTRYTAIDGILYDTRFSALIMCPVGKTGDVTIAEGFTRIEAGAFANCKGISSFSIPSGITSIGANTFSGLNDLTFTINTDSINNWAAVFGNSTALNIIFTADIVPSYAFANCPSIASLVIQDGVSMIGRDAFKNCNALNDVSLGNTLTTIGVEAFAGIPLSEVTLPESLVTLGAEAFAGSAIESIIFPSSLSIIGSNVFAGRTEFTAVIDTENINNWSAVFGNIAKLNIVLSENLTSIRNNAFANCTGLSSITIPDSLTSIGANAFSGYTGFTAIIHNEEIDNWGAVFGNTSGLNIILSDSVINIVSGAFANCTGLASITIPESVTGIWPNAFAGSSLSEVTLPETLLVLGGGAFAGSALKSISLPASLVSIGTNAFSDCNNLTVTIHTENITNWGAVFGNTSGLNIILSDSITSIGYNAFANCTGLASISIPNSVTSIGNSAFLGCTGLASISIPESLSSIGANAFYACNNLTVTIHTENITNWGAVFGNTSGLNIILSDSVTSIGNSAFENCTGLASITIPANVESIGTNVFSGCNNLTVTIHEGENIYWSEVFTGVSSLSVILADGFQHIQSYAFYNLTELVSISLPDSLTWIGDFVFYGCSSLASISIPDSVTGIGAYAFYGCTELTSVFIPDSVNIIWDGAFAECTKLESVILSENITNIRASLFMDCIALKEIIIPGSVAMIEDNAFSGCLSLEYVMFQSNLTESQFSTYPGTFPGNLRTVFFNSSGVRAGEYSTNNPGLGALWTKIY